jgi:signal transduction histidine kinase
MLENKSITYRSLDLIKNELGSDVLNEINQIDSLLEQVGSHFNEASSLVEMGAYSSMFAHEVNNLMTQVGGRAQLALMNMDKPELVLRALELACHACTQVTQLSEIFLSSNTQEGCATSSFHIADIHRRALGFIRDEDIARYGLNQTYPSQSDTNTQQSGICTTIQPFLLEQVLLNLYLNSIRAIEQQVASKLSQPVDSDESPRIELVVTKNTIDQSHTCSTWNTSFIELIVKDTGIGMEADRAANLFNQDGITESGASSRTYSPQSSIGQQQINSTPTRSFGHGHGLGLPICKKLITEAGGKIWVESTPDQGTSVFIHLPVHNSPDNSIG